MITQSHLNNRICQHCGVETSTVTPSFYYVSNIFLSCNINIPSFMGNLWWDLLLGNHLNIFLMIFPRMSLHCNQVPVHYRECEYGQLVEKLVLHFLANHSKYACFFRPIRSEPENNNDLPYGRFLDALCIGCLVPILIGWFSNLLPLWSVRCDNLEFGFWCNISNTRDSVSSGYPNTEKRVQNSRRNTVSSVCYILSIKAKIKE